MLTQDPTREFNTELLSFRLSPSLVEEVKECAAADRRSVANWLRIVIENAVKACKEANEQKEIAT